MEYEVEILEPVKFKIRLNQITEPTPPPEDPEPIPPVVLPATITVGPGKEFEDLTDLPAIPKRSSVILYGRDTPYRSKVGLLQDEILFKGVDNPVLSGEGAKTPQSLQISDANTSTSVIYTGISKGIKIQGIKIQEAWEQNQFFYKDGRKGSYAHGSAAIRSLGGDVSIQDCDFDRLIHAVFVKPSLAMVDNLTLERCRITNCGNEAGNRDEAIYPECDNVVFKEVTIKNNRNQGTTCAHLRVNKAQFINCELEGQGVLIFTDSWESGKTSDATCEIVGGKYISRSPSVFFKLHSDIGSDIAIRDMTVNGATLINVYDQNKRWKKTIGTPFLDGNTISYDNCQFVLMPEHEGLPGTALEYLDLYSMGSVVIGQGNKELICEGNGRIGGANGNGKILPVNWMDLIEVQKYPYSYLQTLI